MELLGNRVFLRIPKQKDTKLFVQHNTKEALQKEMLSKMNKLEVHTIGSSVVNLKIGDLVLVDPSKLAQTLAIDISDVECVLLVNPFDIIMIW